MNIKKTTTSPYYKELKRRLWIGTLLLDAVLAALVLWWAPHLFKYLCFGMGLGFFYLWSLMFNAEFPKNKIQVVFSLIRIVLIAYIIVKVGGQDIRLLALVMCGLLSYKGILTVEYVLQALPALRSTGKKAYPTAEPLG